jgi:hypothetical protein
MLGLANAQAFHRPVVPIGIKAEGAADGTRVKVLSIKNRLGQSVVREAKRTEG